MSADQFDPNTYFPTMAEADRDEHQHSRCTLNDPCSACQREQARRSR